MSHTIIFKKMTSKTDSPLVGMFETKTSSSICNLPCFTNKQ